MNRLVAIMIALCAACASSGVEVAPTTTSSLPSTTTTVPTATTAPTTSAATGTTAPHPTPTFVDENGFDDHSVPALRTVADYHALSRINPAGQEVVKFTIDDFGGAQGMHWMDANFFTLHDEWYWFRLLNGQTVPGAEEAPAAGLRFETIDEIYAWASETADEDRPIELVTLFSQAIGGDRLYSEVFYELVLDSDPRALAAGSLVHLPATGQQPEHWVFELEYSDEPTVEELEIIFDRLIATLPDEIGSRLKWVVRSPYQDDLALGLARFDHDLADRTVRYRDIVEPGQTAVYNPAIAAGRLLVIGEGGKDLSQALSTDIILIENIPDELPPAAALISSAPQTPLAHVNLLARNRGIPNASLSGVLDNDAVRQAARGRAPAIVQALPDGTLQISVISEDAYRTWLAADRPSLVAVAPLESADASTIDLGAVAPTVASEADLARWRPLIGGKATGMLTLLNAGVAHPDRALAITVEPYLDHLAPLDRTLTAMLGDTSFQRSAAIRYLVLEGIDEFADRFVTAPDLDDATEFIRANPEGTLLGDLVAAGGLKARIRSLDMDPEDLDSIVGQLEQAFGAYGTSQGLRFRSSSTVEDIEGFSGAGLYDSNTGFLSPDAAPADDQHKSVEWAIKKTWASYWSFEAFEERRIERIDHRSGAMAILVHARFDDELEVNNGVATITLLPERADDLAVATINAQAGAVSVANPDGSDLPEVIEVRLGRDGNVSLARLAASTVSEGTVLGDEEASELFEQLLTVATLWRNQHNAVLVPDQQVTTLVLDLEFKTMAPGWAAKPSGGLVLKQARSLEPGLRAVPADVLELPLPRDLLARASRVERTGCEADQTRYELFTDPLAQPDMGYSTEPYVVFVDGTGVFDSACRPDELFVAGDERLVALLASDDALSILN